MSQGHSLLEPEAGVSAEVSSARGGLFLHVGILALILVAEVLLLTLRFDSDRIPQEAGWLIWLLANVSHLLRAFIAMVVATLLVGGWKLWRDCQQLVTEKTSPANWLVFPMAHATALLAFARMTELTFEGDFMSRSSASLWVLAWFYLALATFGFWLGAVLHPTLWLPLARKAAKPLLAGSLVGLAAFGFGMVSGQLWLPLSQATFWTVARTLSLFTGDVVCEPANLLVGTSAFVVHIAPECSGYEGIGLIVLFLAAYVWFFRSTLRFPHALLLFPAGMTLIWLANTVRIAALIGIGSAGFREVALGGFHSQAGWLAFNGLALGIVALSRNLRVFQAGATQRSVGRLTNPTVAYLAPWLAILAATMVAAAFSAGFDWLYPLRVLIALAVLSAFRKVWGLWDWSWSWQAVGLGAITFGLWLLLAPKDMLAGSGLPSELTGAGLGIATGWLAFRVLGYVLMVPLAEEMAFRGYLARRLTRREFDKVALNGISWLGIGLSSVLFGLMHGRCWLAGILAGMLFALALRHRGRLSDAVTAHATANALIAVYVLTTGHWSMWT